MIMSFRDLVSAARQEFDRVALLEKPLSRRGKAKKKHNTTTIQLPKRVVDTARLRARRKFLSNGVSIFKMADGVADPSKFPAKVAAVIIHDKLSNGLFATRTIQEGEEVAEYGGKLVFEKEQQASLGDSPERRAQLKNRKSYTWCISNMEPVVVQDHYDDDGVDEKHTMKRKLGRFANSAKNRPGLSDNVKVVRTFHKGPSFDEPSQKQGKVGATYVRVTYVATRPIAAREEILVNYGAGYQYY